MTANIVNLPSRVEISIDSIPKELTSKKKWVVWRWERRGEKQTKPPFRINGERADITKPEHWSTFEEVIEAYSTGKYAGIGFCLSNDDNIVAYDLDHCLNVKNGELQKWAQALVTDLNSYTEVTPSTDGLRIIITGDVPADGRQTRHLESPDGNKQGAVECYKNNRYITVTGVHFPGTPLTLEERPDTIWKEFFESKEKKKITKTINNNEKLNKLYEGDFSDYGSQSDADLALCRYLADVVNGEEAKIDELFRKSKLFRPKWDERHHGDGSTYGQKTLQIAIASYNASYHLTDTGDAKRFAKLVGDKIRYCNGNWYIWDGKRLLQDDTYQIYTYMDLLCKAITDEAKECATEDRKKSLIKHARSLESKGRTEAVIALSRARDPLPVASVDLLDHNNYAFNCQNGIMEKGDLRPHDFQELMTKVSPVSYDPRADSPIWHGFLDQVVGDQDMIDYLARCIGYSMTGLTIHQVIFFVYGLGANGKSTFINTIMSVLGDYSRIVPSEIFMVGKEQHPTGLSDLRGIRMAVASELEEGKRFNEQLLKWITGEERIVARRMHKDFFEFSPKFKLWIVGNHKPTIRGTDYGIRRRFHLIPFEKTITKEEQNPFLKDELRGELVGILNWCVKGLLDWMKQGLNPPARVLAATEDYFEEQDLVSHFIRDELLPDDEVKISAKIMYDRYSVYTKQRGEYVMSNKAFSQKMVEKGHKQIEQRWVGFKLKNYAEEGSIM